MVLIGDVHVGSGVDVVTDLHLKMAHDVAPAADHAPVTDAHHRIGDHVLAGHHAGRDADIGAHQGVAPDVDPALTEERPGREGETAPGSEKSEAGGRAVPGTDGAPLGHPVPPGMDE
jgi:hypothetical protein